MKYKNRGKHSAYHDFYFMEMKEELEEGEGGGGNHADAGDEFDTGADEE